MPFSDDVRNELAAVAPRKECDRLAELSGLAHAAGSVHLRGRGEVAVHLDLGSSAVARRAFALLRSFGVDSEIRTYTQRAFERPTRYQLHVSGDARALQVLHEAGVLTARLAPPRERGSREPRPDEPRGSRPAAGPPAPRPRRAAGEPTRDCRAPPAPSDAPAPGARA